MRVHSIPDNNAICHARALNFPIGPTSRDVISVPGAILHAACDLDEHPRPCANHYGNLSKKERPDVDLYAEVKKQRVMTRIPAPQEGAPVRRQYRLPFCPRASRNA